MLAEAGQAREMDLRKSRDLQELNQWCEDHWERTVKKSMVNCNALLFHDCCYSFSRRAYSKKGSHPPLQSTSVSRIPTVKWVDSADEFFKWMLGRARARQQQGRRVVFPDINIEHRLVEDQDIEADDCGMLAKRCEVLVASYQKSLDRIDELAKENLRLLSASKAWCQKYLALVAEKDSPQKEEAIDEGLTKRFISESEES